MNNPIEDGILGFACADALGVPVEFTARKHDNKLREMVGYGSHKVPEGTWSDDTSMTIATMDSIMKKEQIDYSDIMDKFISWYENSNYTATDKLFDIGITTRNALMRYSLGMNPLACGENHIRSNGNGSLMRILPVVYYCYYKGMDREEMRRKIDETSSLTHAHPISLLGCQIYADYIIDLLNGKSKEEAYFNLSSINYQNKYPKEAIDAYQRIFSKTLPSLEEDSIQSSGYVVSTLEASIWATLKNNDYESAVVTAINLGEDTDTVGAVTGSINGILYGKENIPERWLSKLKKKEYLESLSQEFSKKFCSQNVK